MSGNLVNQLERYHLFAELERDDLRALADRVQEEQFCAGDILCRQGETGHTAYFIASGALRVLRLDPQGVNEEVDRLGPGDYFGETSLLLAEPRDATVEAVEKSTLLYLRKEDFESLLAERPSLLDDLQIRPEILRRLHAPRFRWLDPDEFVVISLRKHISVLIRNLILPGFVFLAFLIGIAYLGSFTKTAWLAGAGLSFIPLLFSLYLSLDHYNDRYILTSRRVVHDERHLLIYESRNEAPLRAIQDVQQVQEGLLAHTFDFGDLIIETAGERGHIVFRQIPHPVETRETIFEQISRIQAVARAEERAAIREALRAQFGMAPADQPTAPPEPAAPQARPSPTASDLLRALLSAFRFFLPPLRYEEGETITWRKHWIALIRPIVLPSLTVAGATLIASYVISQADSDTWPLTLALYSLALVFLIPWWLWRFEDWKNDIYQVTATRIIDVERQPFFLREERREASLGRIQNINLEIPGLVGRTFNFGSVTIETAGSGAFTFEYVRDPRGVQSEIFRRMELFQQRRREDAAQERRAELLTWFNVYDQIHEPPSSQTKAVSSSEES